MQSGAPPELNLLPEENRASRVLQNLNNNRAMPPLRSLVQGREAPSVGDCDVDVGVKKGLDLVQISFLGGVQPVLVRVQVASDPVVFAEVLVGAGYRLEPFGGLLVPGVLVGVPLDRQFPGLEV